jgi:hypothetical protein
VSHNPPDPFRGCDSCRRLAVEVYYRDKLLGIERQFAKDMRRLDRKHARGSMWMWLFIVSAQSLAVGRYLGRGEYGNAASLLVWIAVGHATGWGIGRLMARKRH